MPARALPGEALYAYSTVKSLPSTRVLPLLTMVTLGSCGLPSYMQVSGVSVQVVLLV